MKNFFERSEPQNALCKVVLAVKGSDCKSESFVIVYLNPSPIFFVDLCAFVVIVEELIHHKDTRITKTNRELTKL